MAPRTPTTGTTRRRRLTSSMTTTTVLLATALLATTACAQTLQTCYFPNGSPSTNDVPCQSGRTTHCCNNQSVCLSNGYCQSAVMQPWVLSRGSCTDQTWGSDCPARCRGNRDNPSGGIEMTLLNLNSGGNYCCGIPVVSGGSVACPNGAPSFTIPDASVIFGRAFLANTVTRSGSGSSDGGNASAAVADAPGPSPAVIGAGVGIPLVVLALSLAAWAVWERRRRRRDVAALEEKVAAAAAGLQGGSGPDGYAFYSKAEERGHGHHPGLVKSHATGSTTPTYHTDTPVREAAGPNGSMRLAGQSTGSSGYGPGQDQQRFELGSARDGAQELAG